jgi:rhodanese-related sulfurtransferase
MKRIAAVMLLVLTCLCAQAPAAESPKAQRSIPKEKQTSLGLYLTAEEAYQKWKADPEQVTILDVRTPEEYIFVGHPTMACNVPLKLQVYQWDASGRKLPMKSNPDFLAQVKQRFKPSDTILVICRSGGRSAQAVNALAEAGFKQVYNVIEGMEGDVVEDSESVFHGKRMRNGAMHNTPPGSSISWKPRSTRSTSATWCITMLETIMW